MDLLGGDELERSPVVANCRMNRERGLLGSNGYAREVGFDPLDRAAGCLDGGGSFRWLDLCCGTGRALIEAAGRAHDAGWAGRVEIVGVDLVGMFAPTPAPLPGLSLIEASATTWEPAEADRFDLITCVHGLHYIGDKLGLIARAAGWLADDGRFVASLDLANLRVADDPAGRHLRASFRHAGVEYDPRRRLILARGRRQVTFPYRYLGADATAGPNYTGQPAVASCYER